MSIKNKITFQIGECAENYPWHIHFNYEQLYFPKHEEQLCPHATDFRSETNGINQYSTHYYTIPRAIECHNEGHCNHTILCLDCLLEGIKEKGLI